MKLSSSKYIRIYSDIHLDFDIPKKFKFEMLWKPEKLETDKETTLILAGDIWHAKKPFSFMNQSWLKEISQEFQYIIIILGNHDFWGGAFPQEYNNYREKIKEQGLDNIFLLQDSQLEIGNHKFIGATLWTDFLNASTLCMYNAKNIMNDYKKIKYGTGYGKLTSSILLKAHMASKNYIFDNAKKDYPEQKIWIISHHLPSYNSIDWKYKIPGLELENALYYSNLDELIEESEIDYWIHGHTHHAQDYMINKTRIISNPRGYPGESDNFNPWHLMELS